MPAAVSPLRHRGTHNVTEQAVTLPQRALAAATAIGGLLTRPMTAALAVVVVLVALCVAAAWYSRLPPKRRLAVREFLEVVLPYRRPPT